MSSYKDHDKIFLFGDSLTQHANEQSRGFAFAPALQHAYARRLDVVTRGFSGYNTGQAVHVLPSIIPSVTETSSRIRLIMIFFGANDAVLPDVGSPQHIPLEEYKRNLKTIVTYPALLEHKPKIILVTPPPICEYRSHRRDIERGREKVQRLAAVTKSYADACKEVAEELNVACVDMWTSCMKHAQWSGEVAELVGATALPENDKMGELFHDGLHMNPAGYEILYTKFMNAIEQNYPELLPDELPFVFPTWEEAPSVKGTYN